jgi:fructokinase
MRIGVDLGGTKIEGILLASDGKEGGRKRVDTPQGSYEETVAAVGQVVEALEAEAGSHATVGVGHPGAISRATGLLKNSNSECLNGRPMDQDLARRLSRRVWLRNDADCFALSEAVDGAGAGKRTVFGVIVGTGTGGGIIVDGQPLLGINAIAGEWGHNPMPWPQADEWPGPPCYCGRTGCIEVFLSGPGMSRDFERAGGPRIPAREIAHRATNGDGAASRCLHRYADRMARALASIINVLDPDVIVLGGGVSNIDSLYELVPSLWRPFVFSDRVDTILSKAAHGDSSGVRGAAWLPTRDPHESVVSH